MRINPQDVVVALKLSLIKNPISYADLGKSLGFSASMAHSAVRRLWESGLVEYDTKNVRRHQLKMFLIHGVPYAFPARLKEMTRGMPTAWAALGLSSFVVSSENNQPVWPDPQGKTRGPSVTPLYRGVLHAAKEDKQLYQLLALVDAIRIGKARERGYAESEIEKILSQNASE